MDNAEKLILMITVFWWAMLLISFISDRSRYRNCYFLFFALASTVASSVALSYDRVAALSGLALTITAALLIVPVFLIHNGIVMYRREGHSLANLLSLFLGIIVAVGEIATIYLLLTGVRTDFALQQTDTPSDGVITGYGVDYYKYLALSKYWINNIIFPVHNKRGGNVYLQTWHGTPLKKLGFDITIPGPEVEGRENFYKESRNWDYLISSNTYSTTIFKWTSNYYS